MIDAYGRVAARRALGHGGYGVIDAPLPPALGPTLFRQWGDLPLLAMLLFSAGRRSYSNPRDFAPQWLDALLSVQAISRPSFLPCGTHGRTL